MKLTFLIITLLFHFSSFSQSGPGGVGNSTNNGLWLKASEIQQTNSTNVENWFDLSGNSNTAVQTNSSEQPLFLTTSSINSQPVVRFDGTADQMQIADADILDNSAGLTFFVVLRPNNLDNEPRGILGKRISANVTTNYSYTWFFHGSRYLNVDLNTQNNRFNTSSTAYSNSTNYILGLEFDGSLIAANRAKCYNEDVIVKTSTETSAAIINSNQPLTLGALNEDYRVYLGADYAEVIHYNIVLNTAQRIIINNYLSAQYNISISTNNIYINDEVANGNYDHEVAGIGRVDASNIHNDAQGSSEPRFLNPTDLNNGEFMLWGHNNATGNEYSDIPGGIDGRMNRVWRVSERNTSGTSIDVGTVDLRWDLSKGTPATASHLRLLIDTDNDGNFDDETPISGATSLGGNQFEFSGITLIRDSLRFTLASTDTANTPLPVTWLNFSGNNNGTSNILRWTTASEINNDYFSIEKSQNGEGWSEIGKVSGKGNSTERTNYDFTDLSPKVGENYYRIKQVDFDGGINFSKIIVVKTNTINNNNVYPNPADHFLTIRNQSENEIKLLDALGRTIEVPLTITNHDVILNTSNLKEGIYFIRSVAQKTGQHTITKVIIQH